MDNKRVPLNINNNITALTLAIWISNDGTFVQSSGGREGVRIACNSFTINRSRIYYYYFKYISY